MHDVQLPLQLNRAKTRVAYLLWKPVERKVDLGSLGDGSLPVGSRGETPVWYLGDDVHRSWRVSVIFNQKFYISWNIFLFSQWHCYSIRVDYSSCPVCESQTNESVWLWLLQVRPIQHFIFCNTVLTRDVVVLCGCGDIVRSAIVHSEIPGNTRDLNLWAHTFESVSALPTHMMNILTGFIEIHPLNRVIMASRSDVPRIESRPDGTITLSLRSYINFWSVVIGLLSCILWSRPIGQRPASCRAFRLSCSGPGHPKTKALLSWKQYITRECYKH